MAHSYTNLLFHIIFATKERRPLIDVDFQPRLYDYIGGTIRGLKATSLEIGGIEDHVHILAKLPPTITVSDFLEKLKANTSKWSKSVRRGFGWQYGYFAFSVSESQVPRVRRYIQNQREHHAKLSFRDELIALLKAHWGEVRPGSYLRLVTRARLSPAAAGSRCCAIALPRARGLALGYMLSPAGAGSRCWIIE